MARFFIDRPVFAWVVAIGMMLAGALAIYNLPISQYPPIAPPSISIRCVYPGASAQTVEDSVVQIIEQQMTGLDRMLYIHSTSDSAGLAQIELTFAPGTDPDLAWAKVQNKLQLALPVLPEVVQRQGLRVSKSTRNYLMIIGLTSLDDSLDQHDLSDYMFSQIQYSLARVPGVGEAEMFGAGYAMRIWLDPNKLTNYSMTSDDVIAAVRAYNVQVSAGQFGGMPAVPGQRLNASIMVQSLLKTPEEFGQIPLRNNPDGSIVRLRDVARTELGTEFDNVRVRYNGHPTAGLAIRQEAGANALDTAAAVKAKMEELSRYFPPGMSAVYPFDTTPFVRVAINEVVKTLIEAIILVFLVMFLFLGNMRATLIPTIAVPVVILGTFGVLGLFGYSINMLTMFAMVLAIGLLVDDAIVVVENVERVMSEEGLSPLEATRKSMDQITSALVGIGLVLSAVFGPMMFFGGSTGVIYRQFSITIISSMLLSVLVALILTPVLCASLLKPMGKGHEAAETGFRLLRPFFLWFDHMFLRLRGHYQAAVGHMIGARLRYLAVFVLIVAAMGYMFVRMPTAYLPDEDQGVLLSMVQLSPGSTLEQTEAVMQKVRDHFLVDQKDAVESCMTISGFGLAGQAQNQGMVYIKLRDWDLRNRPDLRVKGILGKAMPFLASMREATVFAFPPPAVTELGTAKGFDFMLQDRGGLGHEKLMEARLQVMGQAMRDPRLTSVRPNGMPDQAEHKVDIDWQKAGTLGVSVPAIQRSISVAFGSAYVNDFIQGGRVHRVYVQADAPYRMLPEDVNHLYVRNTVGGMVPVSALASGRWTYNSPRLERYNGFPALNFLGEAAPGRSTGDAMKAMEEIAMKLPRGIGYDWTGLSYQERSSQAQTGLLYAFSILAIFLVLAALYESWSIPISILLALPLGAIGGVLASSARGLANDVYFQIGLLTVLGLTTKNAILIVQFAKIRVEQGAGLTEATLEGAKLRLRPIVMTSLAFGFGVLPLVVASGAGAGAQMAIGTSVLGGMATATFLAIFFIPLFFVLVTRVFGRKKPGADPVRSLQIPECERRDRNMREAILLSAMSIFLCGCPRPSQQVRPELPVPPAWPESSAGPAAAPGAPAPANLKWQEFFTDQRLQSVIELALANNRDLRVATLNIEKVQALYRIQRAEQYPTIVASAGAEGYRVPRTLSDAADDETVAQFTVGLGMASWELDLFGRIRSLKTRALEQYLATEQARSATQISLVAAVANSYLALAADRENLRLARVTLDAQQASFELIRRTAELGIASDLDLRQAQTQVESARVDIARYSGQVALDENALNLLVGAPVAAAMLADDLGKVGALKDVAADLPSEVLLRRPDILLAEHQLKAAHANIEAARAAFFPRISMTAAAGIVSNDLTNLFKPAAGTWRFAPQAVLPIFDSGARQANYEAAQADRDIAIADYEKSIQSAFREVSDSLSLRTTLVAQQNAQQSLLNALEETYRLSEARYNGGIDSYLSVLVAQRSLYSAQQQLVGVRLARLSNLVTLYKVLGGGA